MKITILTLFSDIFSQFRQYSIINRMVKKNNLTMEVVDLREFGKGKRKDVDDYQYGGGPGMVIRVEPIVQAIRKYQTKNTKIILLSPQGKQFTQTIAKRWSKVKHLMLICGHYEGIDERINHYVDEIISIGDYILTGGEIPAMVIIEAVGRLLDNSISRDSLACESFDDHLLDYPIYTKPIEFEGHRVPAVLLSGDHQKIQAYRKTMQIKKTKQLRPDLYNIYNKHK
ncbi:MAG: tRNA (guanosine(37)-N1)-methyltransferase TrmD [Mycoplasmataceae bacterium]|nr:tRNA (guanosine(37)-N1)-methyltransferase TrmD [Mycoplasmataceae bacterium]